MGCICGHPHPAHLWSHFQVHSKLRPDWGTWNPVAKQLNRATLPLKFRDKRHMLTRVLQFFCSPWPSKPCSSPAPAEQDNSLQWTAFGTEVTSQMDTHLLWHLSQDSARDFQTVAAGWNSALGKYSQASVDNLPNHSHGEQPQ